MKRIHLCCICLLGVALQTLANLPKLAQIKSDLRDYIDSGHYMHDVANAARPGLHYLKMRVRQHEANHDVEKLAVVFDIDETLLSNTTMMKALSFGGNGPLFHQYERQAIGKRMPATAKIFDYARQHDVAIFLITGRSKQMHAPTVKNLKSQGFQGYTALYMWPKSSHQTVAQFKASKRCNIVKQGYHIVLNVGDQWSDMDVRCLGEKRIKLPNPFYFIPSSHRRA